MALNWKNYANFNHFEQFSGQKFKLKPKYGPSLALRARAERATEKNAKTGIRHLLHANVYINIKSLLKVSDNCRCGK